MNEKNAPFILIILIGVAGFMFWLYAPTFKVGIQTTASSGELPTEALNQLPPPPPPPPPPPGMAAIEATHSFSKGSHTVSGTVTKSNPCDTLITAVTVDKSTPPKVAVTLKTKSTSSTCTKTDLAETFSLPFKAPDTAVIAGTLNGDAFEIKEAGAE